MRIGNPSNNEFILELNKINEEIQVEYLKKIIHVTRNVNCDVMLGDSSTKKVETFDIKNVETFFGRFESILSEWNSQGVTYSSDEDLRRIFTKAEIRIGNYIISLHTSLQYHVLLYYKPIQQVIELQKKLSDKIINLKRENIYLIQTPQAFKYRKLYSLQNLSLHKKPLPFQNQYYLN